MASTLGGSPSDCNIDAFVAQSGGRSGPQDEDTQSPEYLLQELAKLDAAVKIQKNDLLAYRQANVSFDAKNETTQLLLNACERLMMEKVAMDQANFQEHTSDVSYVCQYFGCQALNVGLCDAAYTDKVSALRISIGSAKSETQSGRWFFAFCCQADFPPQQAWWTDIRSRLVPRYQVLRGGQLIDTSAAELVPGDILYIRAGQKAPADARVLVMTEGTTVDASLITRRSSDMRPCSMRATHPTLTESFNIVLKGGLVDIGALFCVLIRAPRNPLVSEGTVEDGGLEFEVNTTLPLGMSMTNGKMLFKTLCTKAHLACRSFWAIHQLSNTGALVVLLTQELLERGTLPKFSALVRRLGKALVLVNCDCNRNSLGALSQEVGLESVSFADCVEPGDVSDSFDGVTDTESHLRTDSLRNDRIGFGALTSVGLAEEGRINALAAALTGSEPSRQPGAILNGISQAGLLSLCKLLRDSGRPFVYATSCYHFPRCFRGLVDLRNGGGDAADRCESPQATMAPRVSMDNSSGQCVSPVDESKTTCSPHPTLDRSTPQSPAPGTPNVGKARPSVAESYHSVRSEDPAAQLNVSLQKKTCGSKDPARPGAPKEVLVSLNSIGVVSELADCVLLKNDLSFLGQALEIVHRG